MRSSVFYAALAAAVLASAHAQADPFRPMTFVSGPRSVTIDVDGPDVWRAVITVVSVSPRVLAAVGACKAGHGNLYVHPRNEGDGRTAAQATCVGVY